MAVLQKNCMTVSQVFQIQPGGIIIFGIDEKTGYKVCGVQYPDELEKKVMDQCKEMEPVVRPLKIYC